MQLLKIHSSYGRWREFELEDEEKESKIIVHDVVQKDIKRLSCRFQDLDLVEFQNVLKGEPQNYK
jgi:hypothetical protein